MSITPELPAGLLLRPHQLLKLKLKLKPGRRRHMPIRSITTTRGGSYIYSNKRPASYSSAVPVPGHPALVHTPHPHLVHTRHTHTRTPRTHAHQLKSTHIPRGQRICAHLKTKQAHIPTKIHPDNANIYADMHKEQHCIGKCTHTKKTAQHAHPTGKRIDPHIEHAPTQTNCPCFIRTRTPARLTRTTASTPPHRNCSATRLCSKEWGWWVSLGFRQRT